MTNHLLALIAAHFACSDISETRQMSWPEIHMCNAVYEDIKLEFVPGMDRATYRGLSSADKVAVNRQGFEAFHDWRVKNPGMVTLLENVAKGEAQLGFAL